MACLQFERLGLDRVAVPTFSYVDHNVLQFDDRNPEDHAYLRSWAVRFGARYSRPGNGISHYLHLERFGRPGHVLSARTATRRWPARSGCSGSGRERRRWRSRWPGPYFVERPRVVGVELRGRLQPVGAVEGCRARAAQAAGRPRWPRSDLRVPRGRRQRAERNRPGTICNMVIETGATTGIFPWDERTLALARHSRAARRSSSRWRPTRAAVRRLERSTSAALEPLIALPSSPGNVVPVREAAGKETRQVASAAPSTRRSRISHRRGGARRALPARGAHLTLSPGSRQILDLIVRSGVFSDVLAAGARTSSPRVGRVSAWARRLPPEPSPCAPSTGTSVAAVGRGRPRIHLVSPETAAATALLGVLTDPRDLRRAAGAAGGAGAGSVGSTAGQFIHAADGRERRRAGEGHEHRAAARGAAASGDDRGPRR